VIFSGIPGSGKTTVARTLCGMMGGSVHIQTDVIRSMVSRPNYGGSESAFVYGACAQVAKAALRSGRPAILDGTFARRIHRAVAVRALEGFYSRCLIVRTVCHVETARQRNASRSRSVPDERVVGIYRSFEEPPDALVVDTEVKSARENALLIFDVLIERMPPHG
jgi:predicted kinase